MRAVQGLQIFAPLGHALGLASLAGRMDDAALSILFPAPYGRVRAWMRAQGSIWASALRAMQRELQAALDGDDALRALGVATAVSTRAKSAFSLTKKLLQLSGALVAFTTLAMGL